MANQTAEFLSTLKQEIQSWCDQGIISIKQARKILSNYGLSAAELSKVDYPKKLIVIFSVLGSILVGTGVILFFAANWNAIPKAVKVALIFIALIGAYSIGYYLCGTKKNLPLVGHSLILMGGIFYGAGIWLIAQIFNIQAHFPNGILFWSIGLIPLIWVMRSKSVLTLATGLLIVWTFCESIWFANINILFPFLLFFVYFPLIYKELFSPSLLLALFGFLFWGVYSSVFWLDSFRHSNLLFLVSVFVLGILYYLLAIYHSTTAYYKKFAFPYYLAGILTVFAIIYLTTFKFLVYDLNKSFAQAAEISPAFWSFFLVLMLLCLGLIMLNLLKPGDESPTLRYEMYFLLLILGWGIVYFFVPEPMMTTGYRYSKLQETFLLYPIISNVLLFMMIIGLILVGFYQRKEWMLNLGLFFFVVDAITRYFDLFWKLLPRSFFFIAFGLLLIFGGLFLESKRRKIIRDFREESV